MCDILACYRYGFDYGNVHVVMMSTEHDFTANSEQIQFLDNHLRKVDRHKTPWLIFAGHRPMYIDSTYDEGRAGDQPVARLLRQHVEPLLKVILQNCAYLDALFLEIWCQLGTVGPQSFLPKNLPCLQ